LVKTGKNQAKDLSAGHKKKGLGGGALQKGFKGAAMKEGTPLARTPRDSHGNTAKGRGGEILLRGSLGRKPTKTR